MRKKRIEIENINNSNLKIQPAFLRSPESIFNSIFTVLLSLHVFQTAFDQTNDQISLMILVRSTAPLRLFERSKKLKRVVYYLFLSLVPLLNVFFVGFLIFLIFAIFGVNFFKGTLGYCENTDYSVYEDCKNGGFEWISNVQNCDNVFSCLMLFFQLSTTDSWQDFMFIIVEKNSRYFILFFVFFMTVGSIIIMNLVVTVVIDNFINLKEQEEGISFLTKRQTIWVNLLHEFLRYKAKIHVSGAKLNGLMKWIISIFNDHEDFIDLLVNTLIIMQVIILGGTFFGQSQDLEQLQSFIINLFAILFIFEMSLKLLIMRKLFFVSSLNNFDLFCTLVIATSSVIRYSFLNLTDNYSDQNLTGVTKALSILRIFRLLISHKSLFKTLKNIIWLIPSLRSIAFLIAINLLIFNVFGIRMFGKIKHDGSSINNSVNFENFQSGINILFRCITFDGCNNVVNNYLTSQVGCIEEQSDESYLLNGPLECGKRLFCSFFFLAFMFFSSIIIMNMFLAIVVNNYLSYCQNLPLYDENFESFYNIWSKYDKSNKNKIQPHEFVLLMMELYKPMGIFSKKLIGKVHETSKEKSVFSYEKKKIYHSYNHRIMIDIHNLIKISSEFDIYMRKDRCVHIIDAILLISMFAIFNNKKEMENLMIEHDKFKKNLEKKLFKYNKEWKDEIRNHNESQVGLCEFFYKAAFSKFVRIYQKRVKLGELPRAKAVKESPVPRMSRYKQNFSQQGNGHKSKFAL